ncbi:hypothetical protein KXS07_21515 [Inquilinus limosus]
MIADAIASRAVIHPKGRQRLFEVPRDPAFGRNADPTPSDITRRRAPW